MTPLHVAVMGNDQDSVRILLEDTNMEATELTNNRESSVHLACKFGVALEILEKLLISLRSSMENDKVKEFLNLEDAAGMKAYDYCKAKKRSDMAVVLEEFIDTSKSILTIEFEY
jgi:ankyrin repeat protein